MKERLRELQSDRRELCDEASRLVLHGEELRPRGLQAYFLSRALDASHGGRSEYWTSPAPGQNELARALSSTARAAQHILGDLPLDNKTIQSLMWLLSEYSHHTLGVPERIDLRSHLLQAARGEPALHSLKTYHRDHFFHALEVTFLGHFLLELRLQNGRPLWNWLPRP